MRNRFALAICWIACATFACAATIVNFSPDQFQPALSPLGGAPSGIVAFSWTSSIDYSNVTIQAPIIGAGLLPGALATAWITTSIGPGTSSALATTSFAPPLAVCIFQQPCVPPETTIFQGLLLPAGTYYLVLTGPPEPPGSPESLGWWVTDLPPELGAGISNASVSETNLYANPNAEVNAAFPPGSEFTSYSWALPQVVQINGDPSTPEPGTMLTMASGLLLSFGLGRRGRRGRLLR